MLSAVLKASIGDASRGQKQTLEQEEALISKHATGHRARHSNAYVVLLTLGFGGLQTIFALLSSNGSSYLISLGMAKSLTGLTWLAGPVAGALLQPYVGLCSDKCRLAWGRRRPYILGGSLLIIVATMLLAQVRGIASAVACWVGHHSAEHSIRMVLAVFAVICITCGIQPVQVGLRALIVDRCPPSQQLQANAWVARITGIGNIFSFLAGVTDLPSIVPALGNQFQVLSLIMCTCLLLTTGLTCCFIREDSLPHLDQTVSSSNVFRKFQQIFESARTLPNDIKNVCIVQFFSWMGWFPFLFYISTYTNETYLKGFQNGNSGDPEDVPQDVWDNATREGSASMLIFAIVSLLASTLLPGIISASQKPLKERSKVHLLSRIPPISLRKAWAASQFLFGFTLIVPCLSNSVTAIKVCAGFAGISWACTIWIPFALITTSISARNSRAFVDDVEGPQILEPATVIALHNVAISAPQALTACLSSLVFWASSGKENSIPLMLVFGGLAGFSAIWFTRRLQPDLAVERVQAEESIQLVSGDNAEPEDEEFDIDNKGDSLSLASSSRLISSEP